jgi:hypothetical protein
VRGSRRVVRTTRALIAALGGISDRAETFAIPILANINRGMAELKDVYVTAWTERPTPGIVVYRMSAYEQGGL